MSYSERFLNKKIKAIIDRPIGSKHPGFDNIYPVNYGYIEKTKAPDGKEIDCYILGEDKPLKEFTGMCIAIIKRLDDDDDKLIITNGKDFTDEEIRKFIHFQEKYFKSVIIR